MASSQRSAVWSLGVAAIVWGLVWYPYRVLELWGWSGLPASVLTYAWAIVWGAVLFPQALRGLRWSPALLAMGLAGGACNIAYVLATLHGHVVRVLLLFYLAPLWTVLLAYLLLGERLSRYGLGIVLLSVLGCFSLMWQPGMGWPWPENAAEWYGLAAGLCFALCNVLSRRIAAVPEEARTMAIFLGVLLLGGLMHTQMAPSISALTWDVGVLGYLALVGLVLLAVNMVAQYGFSHVAANRAAVILLLEPVVAAGGAWYLSGETLTYREWLGGALITLAGVLSGYMEQAQCEAESSP